MKSVFITGGTSGIGSELAKLYLKEGFRVGVCGRDKSKFDENFKEHPNLFFYELDVVNRNKTIEVIQSFSKGHGLDVVYANAGISVGSKNKTPNFEKMYQVVDINLKGVVTTFEAAFNIMKEQGYGHLIAVSSVAGYNGLPGAGIYSGTKSAVIKMCESFSMDWQKFNLNVSVVCPGFIDTPLTQKNNHSMPFMMSSVQAAFRIKKAMDNKRVLYVFPKRMFVIVKILELLPRTLYRFIMNSKLVSYSTQE